MVLTKDKNRSILYLMCLSEWLRPGALVQHRVIRALKLRGMKSEEETMGKIKVTSCDIEGLYVIEPTVFKDEARVTL